MISNRKKIKIAILADSTTNYWEVAFRQRNNRQFDFVLYNAPYNQIDYEVYGDATGLYSFEPDYIALFLCVEKMYERFCLCSYDDRKKWANNIFEKIKGYWDTIGNRMKTNIFQFGFYEYDDRIFGKYAYKVEASFVYQVKLLNMLLIKECQKLSNVFYFDVQNYYLEYGNRIIKDVNLFYAADVIFSLDVTKLVVNDLIQVIFRYNGYNIKCLVLDLDDTIWGGNVADLGATGVEIGSSGMGQVFKEIQIWLKELSKRGVLLAVCSKNNLSDAKSPFLQNKEMVLGLEDIAVFQANWEDKATNIKRIQETLNIGMDSIAFLDNSKYERLYVAETLPQCYVVDLPEQCEDYLAYLKELDIFETVAFSEEDLDKVKQYNQNGIREEQKKLFLTYEEYLNELDLRVDVICHVENFIDRALQLIQKTNQFNLRLVRYQKADIENIIINKQCVVRLFRVTDKFGSRGIVGLVILRILSEQMLFIDTFILSCRAFKLGIEDVMLNEIMEYAQRGKYRFVVAHYVKNDRNEIVQSFLKQRGFVKISETLSVIRVIEYKKEKIIGGIKYE